MLKCMYQQMRTKEKAATACGKRWSDIRPWLTSLPLGLCTRKKGSGLSPSPAVIRGKMSLLLS